MLRGIVKHKDINKDSLLRNTLLSSTINFGSLNRGRKIAFDAHISKNVRQDLASLLRYFPKRRGRMELQLPLPGIFLVVGLFLFTHIFLFAEWLFTRMCIYLLLSLFLWSMVYGLWNLGD
ncbi:hypothetical protein SO802_021697 [Lithocarpus litseifolius]|uniref:Uncharacterized protein n=1 Tax=Lithocarpus litseifolius TaxID=425828 RepID=A0AAW2CFU4_9ROSI